MNLTKLIKMKVESKSINYLHYKPSHSLMNGILDALGIRSKFINKINNF
jgi:hypothetical protein